MVFKKVFVLAFLLLFLIYSCESQYRHHSKHRHCGCSKKTFHQSKPHQRPKRESCGCAHKTTPENTVSSDHYVNLNENDEKQGTNTKETSMENKKINSHETKNNVHQNQFKLKSSEPHFSLNRQIHFDQVRYPMNNVSVHGTNYKNIDRQLSEALLKNVWLSHHLDNVNIPNVHTKYPSQKFNSNTDFRTLHDLLHLHFGSKPEDFNTSKNNHINKQKSSESSELIFLPREVIKKQFHKKYHTGDADSNKDYPDISPVTKLNINHNANSVINYITDYIGDSDTIFTTNLNNFNASTDYGLDPDTDFDLKLEHNIPSLRLIPHSKLNLDIKHINTTNHHKINDVSQESYDVPNKHKHTSILIPNKNIRYTTYDLQRTDKQKEKHLHLHQQPNENFERNIPYKHVLTNTFKDYKPITHIVPNRFSYTKPGTKPEKYRKWVLKQIESLNNKIYSPGELDLNDLDNSIFEILSENGMQVTDNGVLIDAYGTRTNIHSLSLTPVIIRNTMPLRHLLEDKYGKKISKWGAPYRQAILVSTTYPQKSLGVIHFEKNHSPLSVVTDEPSIWSSIQKQFKVNNSLRNNVLHEYKPKQELLKNTKSNKSDHDKYFNSYEELSERNNGRTVRRRLLRKIIPRKMYLGSEEDQMDDGYFSNFISQEDFENNGGRLFIPHEEFPNEAMDILSGRQNSPVTIIASKYHKPAKVHMPNILNFLDIAFKNNVRDHVAKISTSPFLSDVELTVPTEPLHSLDLLKNNVGSSLETRIVPNELLRMISGTKTPVIKLKKPRLPTIPLELDFDIGDKAIYVAPVEKIGFGSRSGTERVKPDVPPENNHEVNNDFEMVEKEDNDDGDFRIIGGNAATGSGTPLSNKGRSGYVA